MAVISKAANANTVVQTGWTNPTNAYADDTNNATCAPAKNGTISSDYGFPDFTSSDIPDGSTINSVTMSMQAWGGSSGTYLTEGIQGRDNGANSGSEATYNGTTAQTVTTATLSGITLADLRSASTLLAARVRSTRTGNTSYTAYLDYVYITVDYTAPVLKNSSDAGVGSDAGAAVSIPITASDAGVGSDAGAAVEIGTGDAGVGHDGETTVVFGGRQFYDGYIRSRDAVYETAREGSDLLASPATSPGTVGQETNGPYYVFQTFFSFDTSSLPDGANISAATLTIRSSIKSGTFTIEARLLNWTDPLDTTDWIPGSLLSTYTLLAHLDSTDPGAWNLVTPHTFVSDALAANINLTGLTRIFLSIAAQRTDNAPTGYDEATPATDGTYGPTLTVTYSTATVTQSGGDQTLNSAEAGTGADASSLAAATPTRTEAGTGADSAASVGLASSEAGTGADSAAVSVPISGADTGTGTETATLAAAPVASAEVGSGAEGAGLAATPVPSAEAGTGADTRTGLGITSAEAGTGAEASGIGLVSSEAGTGVEGSGIGLVTLDAGVAADLASVDQGGQDQQKSGVDAASGADVASLDAGVAAAESAVGSEAGTVSVSSGEAGYGADAAGLAAFPVSSDAGGASDATSPLAVSIPGAESATAADAATLAVQLASSDAGVQSDSWQIDEYPDVNYVNASDGGVGAEIAALAAQLVAQDGSTGGAGFGWIHTYEQGLGIDQAVVDHPLGITPDVFYRRRGPVQSRAVSLEKSLMERYGPIEGPRVYNRMLAERKGPFSAGAKYDAGPKDKGRRR